MVTWWSAHEIGSTSEFKSDFNINTDFLKEQQWYMFALDVPQFMIRLILKNSSQIETIGSWNAFTTLDLGNVTFFHSLS